MSSEIEALIRAAWAAREFSYAPYSGFKVGAATLAKDGRVFERPLLSCLCVLRTHLDARRGCSVSRIGQARRGARNHGMNRPLFGRPYEMPHDVRVALERVFGGSIGAAKVIEHSRYARAHFGMTATTRPKHILLAISGAEFVSNPEMLLHEYFHVLHQWNTGRLTRWRYLIESVRSGYWNNRFEVEARDFSAAAVERYRYHLNQVRGKCVPGIEDKVVAITGASSGNVNEIVVRPTAQS